MSNFEIKNQSVKEFTVLHLTGELDAHTAPELENKLQDLISDNQHKIIVNFGSLEYISSAGLGVFMAYIEEVRELGGDIKLTSMSPKVFNVFDLLGFPTLYDILDNDDDAISRFTS